MRLYGVSRTTQINFLLSFNITSAARVIRSVLIPEAILPIVPMEQGIMIMVSYLAEPEAKGAMKSSVSNTSKGKCLNAWFSNSVSHTVRAFLVITMETVSHWE